MGDAVHDSALRVELSGRDESKPGVENRRDLP
jgi:hypothetical protein